MNHHEVEILPVDYIPKEFVVGRKYHLSWATNRGMVWILKGNDSEYASLETPKTKKVLLAKLADLRELNRFALLNAKNRVRSLLTIIQP